MPTVQRFIPDGPSPDRVIGVVNPYDMALDRELWRWMPDDVSLVVARTPHHPLAVDELMASALGDDAEIRATARSLAAVEPEAVVFACTSGSFVNGVAGARRIAQAITEETSAPAVTTSEALLEALDVLGVQRLAIATPYVARLTALLEDFLQVDDRTVVRTAGLGLDRLIWHVPYSVTADLVRDADHPDAEAVFVSCTNLPTFAIITALEDELGKPVLTANQVTAWAGLRRLGLRLAAPDQRLGAV
ncbi:Asp/Glu/hydantoin racemase [Tersicoccus phoenicis]|uniref:Asp/Glu/hydantoin racemase n=1 Tax=Tersicoccus phoenicis TaxID=554083 RepID=A0A1R1LJI4_9MICC|nr:Asp/Glu/hydantoin racemase [Tersicoccus phoenicis]OMH27684.1 Asp/Glu/hydantoin racemase [Tersicoccus phoenicis]